MEGQLLCHEREQVPAWIKFERASDEISTVIGAKSNLTRGTQGFCSPIRLLIQFYFIRRQVNFKLRRGTTAVIYLFPFD